MEQLDRLVLSCHCACGGCENELYVIDQDSNIEIRSSHPDYKAEAVPVNLSAEKVKELADYLLKWQENKIRETTSKADYNLLLSLETIAKNVRAQEEREYEERIEEDYQKLKTATFNAMAVAAGQGRFVLSYSINMESINSYSHKNVRRLLDEILDSGAVDIFYVSDSYPTFKLRFVWAFENETQEAGPESDYVHYKKASKLWKGGP